MNITTFPHCGRTFVCNDVVGLTDVRKAIDAFQFSLQYGDCQVNAFSRAWNLRVASYRDPDWEAVFDEPLVGFTHDTPFIKQATPYIVRMPLELVDSYDAAEITIGFRMLDRDEANLSGGGSSTDGVQGQKITINIDNLANGTTAHVLDIYYNRSWYFTNISTIGSNNAFLDLSNIQASTAFSSDGLTQDGHNVITIFKAIPASLRQLNRACAGSLRISYEFPRDWDGTNWVGAPTETPNEIKRKLHPLSSTLMAFSGVNEVQARFFRTASWTQGTATATLTMSRSYALTPLPSFPAMGTTYTAPVHNYQNALANSVKGIGWSAIKAVGSVRGGFVRPLAGFSQRGNESAETLTFYGEIPQGATQFMLLAYVKTDNLGGSNQTITFNANPSITSTLTSTSHVSSGSNLARWYYATGTITALNQPVNGQVNRLQFQIESSKSIYTTNRNSEPLTYWDGCHSVLVKFF